MSNKVNIYIDVYHTGNLKTGTGTYCIVLEYITSKGAPRTREYIEGVDKTSANRTAMYACIAALGHLLRPCELQISINSEYVVQAISAGYMQQWIKTGKNAKGKPVKNLDLWQQLAGLMDQHKIKFIYAGSSSYTPAMANLLNHTKINYKEDNYV